MGKAALAICLLETMINDVKWHTQKGAKDNGKPTECENATNVTNAIFSEAERLLEVGVVGCRGFERGFQQ